MFYTRVVESIFVCLTQSHEKSIPKYMLNHVWHFSCAVFAMKRESYHLVYFYRHSTSEIRGRWQRYADIDSWRRQCLTTTASRVLCSATGGAAIALGRRLIHCPPARVVASLITVDHPSGCQHRKGGAGAGRSDASC